jgi:hypothetical protein
MSAQPSATPAGVRHVTIPYLANATRPSDLDFAAAQCDIGPSGERMECRFRQLFLTIAPLDPAACVLTTNGYERTFSRESATTWTDADPPSGDCGVVETTTLEDGGGVRWTMTIRKAATQSADRAACAASPDSVEVYSWRAVKRALPCTSIQPGAIER